MMGCGDNDLSVLLVVDDEEGMRETLTDVLEEFDFEVDSASDGREAVEKVNARDYALVLMDVRMPVMDGVEALRRIRVSRPRIPVIMMTAYADSAAVEDARDQGVEAILGKPLNIGELLPLIREITSSSP